MDYRLGEKLESMQKIIKIVPYIFNFIIIVGIIFFIFKTDSDKSPIIFMIFYPILILLNLITLVIFILFKNKIFVRILKLNLVLLFIFIIPLITIITLI